jgi:hypothetical protein
MLNRFAARRDSNEQQIVRYLQNMGASVYRLSGAGLADLLVGFMGKDLKLEVKTKKGRLTSAQKDMRASWNGSETYIVKTLEDVDNVLRKEGLIE